MQIQDITATGGHVPPCTQDADADAAVARWSAFITELKGTAKPILWCSRRNEEFALVLYPDESWGITRNGSVVGAWEPAEQDDCLATFGSMCGLGQEPLTIVTVGSHQLADTELN